MTFKIYSQYLMTNQMNQWCYMLYHFPLFKRVPLTNLVNSKLKKFVVKVQYPFSLISSIIRKIIYVLIISAIALLLNETFNNIELLKVPVFGVLLLLMVFNRLSILFIDNPERWTITKQFHVEPQKYYDIAFLWKLLDRLIYAGVLFLMFQNYGITVALSIALAPLFLMFQVESFVSYYYSKNRVKPSVAWNMMSFIVSLLIFSIILLSVSLNIGVIYVIVFELVSIILGYLYFKKLEIANEVQRYMINYMDVDKASDDVSAKANVNFLRGDDVVDIEDSRDDFNKLKGYTLLNKLFFKRHKRLWMKPLKITGIVFLVAVGLILVVRLFVTLFDPTSIDIINSTTFDLNKLSAPILFILFLTNRTEILTKSMYINCDYSFLHYPFYKQKEFIWKQYLVRFKSCILVNIVQPIAFLLLVLLASAVGFIPFNMESFLRLTLNLLCGNLIITAVYLSLYYIFQPFTKNMTVKNGFYTFFTSVTSFFFIYSRDTLAYVTSVLWMMPVIFVIVLTASLIGVSVMAPKNFRYKN